MYYYAARYRNISADKLHKLGSISGNRAAFTNKILRPEKLTIDYCITLCGIVGVRLDVMIALLFSIYKTKTPAWYYKIQPPKKFMLKEDAKYRKRYDTKKPMAYHNIAKNAPLIYYTQTLGISAKSMVVYLQFRNSNTMAKCFRWPTQLKIIDVIKLSILTNQKFSVTLNRLLSNTGNQDSFVYIRPEKVDNIVPVPTFEIGELIDEVKDSKPLRKIPLSKPLIDITKETKMYNALEILMSDLGITEAER